MPIQLPGAVRLRPHLRDGYIDVPQSAGAAAATYASTVLSDSPVAYWRFNESSGTSAADSAGANTGTYVGTPTLGVAGATSDGNLAVALNGASAGGSTQRITVPDAAALRITGNMTLEAWIKPTDWAHYAMLVSKGTVAVAGPYEWRFPVTTGVPELLLGNGTTASGPTAGTTAPTLGAWSHVAVTVSGTTVTHYLNGAANGGGTNAQARGDSGHGLIIGEREDINGDAFKGVLDEVAIYNTALSGARIAAHCAAR